MAAVSLDPLHVACALVEAAAGAAAKAGGRRMAGTVVCTAIRTAWDLLGGTDGPMGPRPQGKRKGGQIPKNAASASPQHSSKPRTPRNQQHRGRRTPLSAVSSDGASSVGSAAPSHPPSRRDDALHTDALPPAPVLRLFDGIPCAAFFPSAMVTSWPKVSKQNVHARLQAAAATAAVYGNFVDPPDNSSNMHFARSADFASTAPRRRVARHRTDSATTKVVP